MLCGVDDKSKGRGKEGCALLMSPRIWEGIEAHRLKRSRLVWAIGKVEIVKSAWVYVYALVNAKSRKGREIRKFLNYVK